MSFFVPLDELAQVSLGYKSLQNDFYYVNRATIDTYGIEKRYLQPITLFRGLDGASYCQDPPVSAWLFMCREKKPDLRGTGALKYIYAMSERPAAEKKQSGGKKTIREVLKAQSSGLWYAPKAKPHPARLWLRKAFNTVYAPFIFENPAVVDQRCNYIEPVKEVCWEQLGAALTATIFAYGVEINGSASMGAGALETPTSKLRRYPIFDPRTLKAAEQKELVKLARTIWSRERPTDWSANGATPGPHLRALDEWLLTRSKCGLSVDQLYADLRATSAARITVAKDKVRTKKKHRTDNVATVAKEIAEHLGRLLNARQFPESFYDASGSELPIHFARSALRRITIEPLLDQAEIALTDEGGKPLFKGSFNVSIVEAIVRSILLGRENFQVPARREEAAEAITAFFAWFDDIQNKLNDAINDSALGTGYESLLRTQVYRQLGVHPLVGARALPHEINFPPLLD